MEYLNVLMDSFDARITYPESFLSATLELIKIHLRYMALFSIGICFTEDYFSASVRLSAQPDGPLEHILDSFVQSPILNERTGDLSSNHMRVRSLAQLVEIITTELKQAQYVTTSSAQVYLTLIL